MNDMGHNESAVRLAALAGDAQIALDRVARGEADANEGWMAYGAALNEGRALCTSEDGVEDDRSFGKWMRDHNLRQVGGDQEVHDHEREAAMWMAANADQLAEAKAASNARTPRGWHDQWKKIEKERERAAAEAERKAKQEAERQARAEEARKAKEEAEAKEADARAAAAAATDDEERKAAQAKAEEAAKATADADAKAQEAANEASPSADDPYAKYRKGLDKFTREGIEDELIEARIALAEKDEKLKAETAKRRAAQKEVKELRETIKAISETDKNAARYSKLREDMGSLKFRMKDEEAKNSRLQRRVNIQAAEIKTLKKRLANQEFVI